MLYHIWYIGRERVSNHVVLLPVMLSGTGAIGSLVCRSWTIDCVYKVFSILPPGMASNNQCYDNPMSYLGLLCDTISCVKKLRSWEVLSLRRLVHDRSIRDKPSQGQDFSGTSSVRDQSSQGQSLSGTSAVRDKTSQVQFLSRTSPIRDKPSQGQAFSGTNLLRDMTSQGLDLL